MSTEPDELAAFTAAVSSHLGTEPAERPPGLQPSELLGALTDEALGLVSAGYRIWSTTQAAQAAARRLVPRQPARPAMAYGAASKKDRLCVVQDTREHIPAELFGPDVDVVQAKLDLGDYSAKDLTSQIAIEAKFSLDDLIAAVTTERERFERELAGLQKHFPHRAIVVAASELDVLRGNYTSRVPVRSVLASFWAWQQDFAIPIIFCGDVPSTVECIKWWLLRAKTKADKAAKAAKQKAVA